MVLVRDVLYFALNAIVLRVGVWVHLYRHLMCAGQAGRTVLSALVHAAVSVSRHSCQ